MSQIEETPQNASGTERLLRCNERAPDERPSEAVVAAVAEASGKAAVPGRSQDGAADALPPLYEAIDPEALDTLVSAAETRGADCSVQFSYGGYSVTVMPRTIRVTTAD